MSNIQNSDGVVTFLDVLGWKGIWQRKQNPIADLEELVKEIEVKIKKITRGTKHSNTSVMIISDTILIFSPVEIDIASQVIDIHGEVCSIAIPSSIKKGIPLRGATSYGQTIINNNEYNIYAGKSIDEAASWHEKANWIGVHLTPSAVFVYKSSDDSKWINYTPPFKDKINFDTFSLNWIESLEDLNNYKKDFVQLGPIVPEISDKFTNTIKFLELCISK